MLYLGIDQNAKQLTISLRNDAGDIVLKRHRRSLRLQRLAPHASTHRWLHPDHPDSAHEKKLKVKTDKRDAHGLSELLWVNQHRLRTGEPVRDVRQVILPSKHHAESQRITLLRKDAGGMRTRATNRIKNILRKHNLQWQMPAKAFPSVRAIAWLKTVELTPCERAEMDWQLDELERWTKRMQNFEVQIIERSNDVPRLLASARYPAVHTTAVCLWCAESAIPIGSPRARV